MLDVALAKYHSWLQTFHMLAEQNTVDSFIWPKVKHLMDNIQLK